MSGMRELLDIMRALRDPQHGCPWDRKQDFSTIAPYTIEEAYEVADAIQRGSLDELKDELGDLLFQVVFHAQMAEEQGAFDFSDVVASLCDKMVRRHPHVFDDAHVPDSRKIDAQKQTDAWEQAKAQERRARGAHSLMDDVPRGMAELQRSVKLQKRAAQVGFDWGSAAPVLDKFEEETAELRAALDSGDPDQVEDELGDLLFVVTNLARQLKMDPAGALRGANAKFEQRFRAMEEAVGGQQALDRMALDDMEALWQQVKRELRNGNE